MNWGYNSELSYGDAGFVREINIDSALNHLYNRKTKLDEVNLIKNLKLKKFTPYDYLEEIESYIPEDVISSKNYNKIKNLAENFDKNLTSFMIFETRLNQQKSKSDYCFAISSKNEERESLIKFLEEKNSKEITKGEKWNRIHEFTQAWANPESWLYNNIQGLWFEFDTSISQNNNVPSIFFHINKINTENDIDWLINNALKTLNGKKLSTKTKENIKSFFENLPTNSSVFQIGMMLSRETPEIRLVIKRIDADQIIPYLRKIGYTHKLDDVEKIIDEVKHFVNRFVLQIGFTDKLNKKIGIEFSFCPDNYHNESRWLELLNYLENKGLCSNKKISSLMNFSGSDLENSVSCMNLGDCKPLPIIKNLNLSTTILRYLSHIKIVYAPDESLEVKAYPAVRLFGYKDSKSISKLIKN